MTDFRIVGEAVLRDFPLRLWAEQQEHTTDLLREFTLILAGEQTGSNASPPEQLLNLAELFTSRFGALINAINEPRQQAWDAGQDRMDSVVPLPEETPELIAQVATVLAAVDEYCVNGDLLTLARTPEQLAFSAWTNGDLIAQYHGGEPTPWTGPF